MVATRTIIPSPKSQGNPALVSRLLTDLAAVDDGDWIDTLHYAPLTFHVIMVANATVDIRGSNETVKPANTVHGIQIGADVVNSDALVESTGPFRWIKARVTVRTTGTGINVYMVAAGND